MIQPSDILHFWFEETPEKDWFQGGEAFDAKIKERFRSVYDSAAAGAFESWAEDAQGALALCIVLDQFPRNMFRGSAQAFASDDHALRVARQAVERGFDRELSPVQRRFLYLPFEHSEDLADQKRSVALFETIREEDELGYDYALRHLDVIERFGRFPHRNAALGRTNTAEEEDYLSQPGAGF